MEMCATNNISARLTGRMTTLLPGSLEDSTASGSNVHTRSFRRTQQLRVTYSVSHRLYESGDRHLAWPEF